MKLGEFFLLHWRFLVGGDFACYKSLLLFIINKGLSFNTLFMVPMHK